MNENSSGSSVINLFSVSKDSNYFFFPKENVLLMLKYKNQWYMGKYEGERKWRFPNLNEGCWHVILDEEDDLFEHLTDAEIQEWYYLNSL
jgi:hypothetical protein